MWMQPFEASRAAAHVVMATSVLWHRVAPARCKIRNIVNRIKTKHLLAVESPEKISAFVDDFLSYDNSVRYSLKFGKVILLCFY